MPGSGIPHLPPQPARWARAPAEAQTHSRQGGEGTRLEGHVKALQLTPKERVCLSPEPRTTSKGSFRSFLCLPNVLESTFFPADSKPRVDVFPKAFPIGF